MSRLVEYGASMKLVKGLMNRKPKGSIRLYKKTVCLQVNACITSHVQYRGGDYITV